MQYRLTVTRLSRELGGRPPLRNTMAKINENKLAQIIVAQEGGAVSLPIGQVKEVLRITLEILAQEKASDVLKLVEKHA